MWMLLGGPEARGMLLEARFRVANRLMTTPYITLGEGELAYLTGPTGSGKTTALYAIAGLVGYEGSIRVLGREVRGYRRGELARAVGLVLDEVDKQFVAYRVADEVAFLLENMGVDREEVKRRVSESLRMLGVERLMWRPINTLSSGEKARVAIASALAGSPRLLLLDNFLARLDPPTARRLRSDIERIAGKEGLGVVVTSHEAPPGASKVFELGAVKPYNNNLVSRLRRPGRVVLRARDVWFWYDKREPVLRGVSLEVREGEILAVMGRNGAGKTTLAKIISGLIKPKLGRVETTGGHVVYVPEDTDSFFVATRPIDEVSVSVARSGLASSPARVLDELGLSGYSRTPLYSLSLGVRKLVAVAAALPLATLMLVVDEPTVGLDRYHSALLARGLSRVADSGKPVVVVTHDEWFARLVSDRVVVIKEGRVVYDGGPDGAEVV